MVFKSGHDKQKQYSPKKDGPIPANILLKESARIKNRLHELLFNQYMEVLKLFSSLFSKCAPGFFSKYPDPFLLKDTMP
jgi:hypothetical protein